MYSGIEQNNESCLIFEGGDSFTSKKLRRNIDWIINYHLVLHTICCTSLHAKDR